MLFQISLIATVVAAYFAKEWYQFSNPDCEISGRSLGMRDRFWKPIVKVLQLGNVDEQRIRAKELEKGKRRTTVDEMKTCRKEHETHQHNINYMKVSAGVAVAFAIAGFVRASRRDTQSYAEDEMTLENSFTNDLIASYGACASLDHLTQNSREFKSLVKICSDFINAQSIRDNKYEGVLQSAGMLHNLQNMMSYTKQGRFEVNRLFLKNQLLPAIYNKSQRSRNDTLLYIARMDESMKSGLLKTTYRTLNTNLAKKINSCNQYQNRDDINKMVAYALEPNLLEKIQRDNYAYGDFTAFFDHLKDTLKDEIHDAWALQKVSLINDLDPILRALHRIGVLAKDPQFLKYDQNSLQRTNELERRLDNMGDQIHTRYTQFFDDISRFMRTYLEKWKTEISQRQNSIESPDKAASTPPKSVLTFSTLEKHKRAHYIENQKGSPSTDSDRGDLVPSPTGKHFESP